MDEAGLRTPLDESAKLASKAPGNWTTNGHCLVENCQKIVLIVSSKNNLLLT